MTGAVTWTGGSSTNANTAYTYSQVGHLPLSGGTITGNVTLDSANPILDVLADANADATIRLRETGTGIVGAELVYDGGTNKFHIKAGNNPTATALTIDGDTRSTTLAGALIANSTATLVSNVYLGNGLTRLNWGWGATSGTSLRNYLAPRNDADDAWNYSHEFGYDHNVNAWYIDTSCILAID